MRTSNVKKQLTLAGAAIGFLCGVGIIVFAWANWPSTPGIFELMLQAVIVAVLALAGAVAGFLLGCLVGLFLPKQ